MKFLIFNRKIQLLVLLWGGVACVSQGVHEQLKEENRQLKDKLKAYEGQNLQLTQYVDSIVPLLTLNRSASIRDRVFPTIVRFKEKPLPYISSPASPELRVSQEDLNILDALNGRYATLTEEGSLDTFKVSPALSTNELRQQLQRAQQQLWTMKGDTYRKILSQDEFFSYGNVALRSAGKQFLSNLAKRFVNLSDYDIYIESHTDGKEAPSGNGWDLSAKRAANLADFLESKGVSSENLVAAGRGHFDSFVAEINQRTKNPNRKIEFILMPKSND